MTALPFRLAANLKLHAEIAASHPSLMRGRVWCTRCNAFKNVDAARCLAEGWPKCHGMTMSIDSPKERNKHGRS